MLDWLEDVVESPPVKPEVLAARLATALALGCVVAGVYLLTRRRARDEAASFLTTLVLLTVLIGMVTLVIGKNVALAFSLVGALAIVRFRTVVEDTRDTAFVMFAVVVGMAAGAGAFWVLGIGLPIGTLAALLFRPRLPEAADATLVVRLGVGRDPTSLLAEPFAKHLARHRLVATSTARGGAALELTYAVRLRRDDDALPLVSELNAVEGMQSVELRAGPQAP
jgi:hypothetical protein